MTDFASYSAAGGKEFSVIQQIDTLYLCFHNSSEVFLLFPLFANTLQFTPGNCGTDDSKMQSWNFPQSTVRGEQEKIKVQGGKIMSRLAALENKCSSPWMVSSVV